MKKIRLIEFFAGYGSQALALKYLGIPFEHWKICEWAVKSIQAYKDIHFTDDNEDYSMLNNLSYEELVDILYNYGISQNYNEPMKLEQIKRLGETQVRKIFNNIVATHNLVNIQKVKGYSLEIEDIDNYTYLLTYSFPCQDLSMAGKRKGMSDTSTRSGMLWEVERILKECENKPQILLMENVPQVHGKKNIEDFNKWINSLEEMGYKNYWQDLIATDYGIPQTRKRTFMVSILGDEKFEFPKPIPLVPLELKLKDLLEENVDEKYYLSDKMINCFINPSESGKKFGRDKQFLKSFENEEIARTITTRAGDRASDNFILTKDTENYIEWEDGKNIQMNCCAWKEDKVVATLNCGGETIDSNLRIRKLTPKTLLDYITNLQNQLGEKTYLYNKLDTESNYVITKLQEENKKLQKDLQTSIDICNNRQKEIVRLNNIINELEKYCDDIERRSIDITDTDYDLGQDYVAREILKVIRGEDNE